MLAELIQNPYRLAISTHHVHFFIYFYFFIGKYLPTMYIFSGEFSSDLDPKNQKMVEMRGKMIKPHHNVVTRTPFLHRCVPLPLLLSFSYLPASDEEFLEIHFFSEKSPVWDPHPPPDGV